MEALCYLRSRYSRREINDALDKIEFEGLRKRGAPPDPINNRISIAVYIECCRKKSENGKLLGVTGAAMLLEKLWRKHTRTKKDGFTYKRLRAIYYEIKREAETNPKLSDQIHSTVAMMDYVDERASELPGAVYFPTWLTVF